MNDKRQGSEKAYGFEQNQILSGKFCNSGPADTRARPADLQNNRREEFAINKCIARGKRYAYIRGTNISLVRGFEGSPEAFDEAIDQALAEYATRDHVLRRKLRAAAAVTLHKRTLSRARTKGREYILGSEIIRQMLEEAKDRCVLTGLAFDYNERTDDEEWLRRPLSPSIDRIDNRRGYELDNIRIVCTAVNIAINEWGLETFDKVCRALIKKSGERAA